MNIALWIGIILFVIPLCIMIIPATFGLNKCTEDSVKFLFCNLSLYMLIYGATGLWTIGIISFIIGIIIAFLPGGSSQNKNSI